MHLSHHLLIYHIIFDVAWDCSGWVRTYALFLEERLECYRVLKYDIEAERLPKASGAASKVYLLTSNHQETVQLCYKPLCFNLLCRRIEQGCCLVKIC